MTFVERFLEDVKGRLRKATPGPWVSRTHKCSLGGWHESVGNQGHGDAIFGGLYRENLDFIAHARTDIDLLVGMVEKAILALRKVESDSCWAIKCDALAEIDSLAQHRLEWRDDFAELENATLRELFNRLSSDNSGLRRALRIIQSQAGNPDAAEACRIIIKTAAEAVERKQ